MLNIILRIFGLLTMCALTFGCDQNATTWVDLPPKQSAGYKLSIQTFRDNESIAQPFKLGIRASRGIGHTQQILSAEQCKNVEVFQDDRAIVVLYDDLVLDQFSGYDLGGSVPRTVLCDNHHPTCQALRQSLVDRKISGVPVCKYAGK